MTALQAPRLTKTRTTIRTRRFAVAASTVIWQGAMVALATSGGVTLASPATAATGLTIVGLARATADNRTGVAGAITVDVENDVAMMNNDATNPVTAAQIGQSVYAIDDNTVSSLATGRSAAGVLVELDPVTGNPWVKFTA